MANPKDYCYEDMTKGNVFEQTEVPYHNPPLRNEFENAKWNSNGFDQSGMKGK